MKKLAWICFASLFSLSGLATNAVAPPPPPKKLKVVTTLNVLAELAKEIGGDKVEAHSLSKAEEDPHFVKAKPTFKRLVSDADLFMQVGRSLELWVPLVINASQNAKLTSGKGLITLSTGVPALDVPSVVSRASGDIHPDGNPHIWLGPLAIKQVASNIKEALSAADGANKSYYEQNFQKFNKELAIRLFGDDLVKSSGSSFEFLFNQFKAGLLDKYLAKKHKKAGGWVAKMAQVDYPFYTYHKGIFSYLAKDFPLKIAGQLEEKAGVAPSKKYETQMIAKAKELGVKHIIAASYYKGTGASVIKSVAEAIGGQSLFIDVDCLENETYFAFMDRIVDSLVKFKGQKKQESDVKSHK